MRFDRISPKQAEIFKFMAEPYESLICDGAVRSGKTIMMITAFVEWAMAKYDRMSFGVCGKTVRSAERNIISPYMILPSIRKKYRITYNRSMSLMTIRRGAKMNFFYVFGGKDESSYTLIQGVTLAGVLLDEVALMPRSFVDQAMARTISVENAKLWFNCNPEGPQHWFFKEWVLRAGERNAKHLHFQLEDNPSLSAKQIEKTKQKWSGVFYDRYIRGLWVVAEGLIYDMFSPEKHVVPDIPLNAKGKPEPRKYREYVLSCDYGTYNPFALGLFGYCDGVWYLVKEYYYDGRKKGMQKTDEEYYQDLLAFVGEIPVHHIIVDPAAASFIACLRRHGRFIVVGANNAVVDGIRMTGTLLSAGKLFICQSCKNTISEIQSYRWDDRTGEDKPIKENDHAMDMLRYMVYTHIRRNAYKYGLHLLGVTGE